MEWPLRTAHSLQPAGFGGSEESRPEHFEYSPRLLLLPAMTAAEPEVE